MSQKVKVTQSLRQTSIRQVPVSQSYPAAVPNKRIIGVDNFYHCIDKYGNILMGDNHSTGYPLVNVVTDVTLLSQKEKWHKDHIKTTSTAVYTKVRMS